MPIRPPCKLIHRYCCYLDLQFRVAVNAIDTKVVPLNSARVIRATEAQFSLFGILLGANGTETSLPLALLLALGNTLNGTTVVVRVSPSLQWVDVKGLPMDGPAVEGDLRVTSNGTLLVRAPAVTLEWRSLSCDSGHVYRARQRFADAVDANWLGGLYSLALAHHRLQT